jgi:hypothetical protein
MIGREEPVTGHESHGRAFNLDADGIQAEFGHFRADVRARHAIL